jgi:GNAT superfamily N-acetyltransferase
MKLKAERIAQNPKYRIAHISRGNLDKYAEEFRHVYNNAWSRHAGVKEITLTHAKALLNSMKPILDERLVWFAYYEDEPVGFFIMIPEMNQVFRHINGKLDLLGKLKFLWYFKIRKVATTALGLIFGIAEDHQRKGVDGAIVTAFKNEAIKKGFSYTDLELNWIGDFNPTMMRVAEMVGCKIRKTHITYRFLFDRNKEFVRAKRVN